MVEMANVECAERAYNALQQSLFRGQPLYLEYGRVVGSEVSNELPRRKGKWHDPKVFAQGWPSAVFDLPLPASRQSPIADFQSPSHCRIRAESRWW